MSYDKTSVNFLDVTIGKNNTGLLTSKLHRKETAGNSLLHATSFHPEALKRSIPYSQYLRVKRNCTSYMDFQEEADKLTERFLERGYTKSSLRKAFNRVKKIERHNLIFKPKKIQPGSQDMPRIILTYTNEHESIRKILQKNWSILTNDTTLKQLVPSRPLITFRKAGSIHENIVQSEFKGKFRKDPCKDLGTFPCGRCSACHVIPRCKSTILPNGMKFTPRHFVNCHTRGVVYLMRCECQAFYVGKTKQELQKRVNQHLTSMEMGNFYVPLGRHVTQIHQYKMPKVSFVALDRIHIPIRGGDWNKTLLQREARWINRLKATQPPGMNEIESFRPFLEGFASGKTD